MLVIADSLSFHGPVRAEGLRDPRLYPNVATRRMGELLGQDVRADVVARPGWTARDAWWALTKDPAVYSLLLPRASAVVLGVGGMDYLPAVLPTYLRDGIAYLRPGWLRRRVRRVFRAGHPYLVRGTGLVLRGLPQAATDAYLSRCVQGIRLMRPGVPVVALLPPPHDAPFYGGHARGHASARAAGASWGAREGVPLVDPSPFVAAALAAGDANPDGLHWSFAVHAQVGAALGELLGRLLAPESRLGSSP